MLEGGKFTNDLQENLLGFKDLSLEIIGPSQEVVNPVNVGATGIGFDVCLELILRKTIKFIVKGADGNG